jgi:hypothetical protein
MNSDDRDQEENDAGWMRDVESIQQKHAAEIDDLKSKITATEVQRDTALDACQSVLDLPASYDEFGQMIISSPGLIGDRLRKALELTPERAASVINERDRLRSELEEMAILAHYCDARWIGEGETEIHPSERARQALEGSKGETNATT